ncbi:FMN-dependent NADH-azoreductase [Chitinophaga sp. SYP-B3965]|uniref:FMN-dependent NADH-azoreductase n=1 Tax=Chitinophaga sp. SYP-B3965 TaxID=2663120 RepID=UPI00129995A9|nr:NAD(P)H-dependent oxidoreductase [Chitinophaga sp. SYP-B3965]MRG45758.1 FMN-dependent NADH-azoreductase [Chitinophaga sp. SYP-B3965]
MKRILHISSSPRGEASSSIMLANRIIEKIQNLHPGSTVVVNDTTAKDYPHLDAQLISAYKTMEESAHLLKDSDAAVKELFDADIIVIGVPMYNFNMPSALKAWIDHVVRPGVTFSYANGLEGLLKDKKVYLALAAHGVYSDGPMKDYDFSEPYLRYILGFIGLTDITSFRIEGGGIPGIMETAVEKGLDSVVLA